MPEHTDITAIVAVVRRAGPQGCTAEAVCGETNLGFEAVRAGLGLQVQAGIMSLVEDWEGECYRPRYTIREGA